MQTMRLEGLTTPIDSGAETDDQPGAGARAAGFRHGLARLADAFRLPRIDPDLGPADAEVLSELDLSPDER